jgi:hypothetical protein
VGFPLPSAGVTPAPSDKKSRNVEDNLSLSRSVFVSLAPCVIPSEAEGPRILLDASRRTLNHESTERCDARSSFRRFVSFTEPFDFAQSRLREESRLLLSVILSAAKDLARRAV